MNKVKLKARSYGKGRKIFEIPSYIREDYEVGETYEFKLLEKKE
jgi:hypothetical protein